MTPIELMASNDLDLVIKVWGFLHFAPMISLAPAFPIGLVEGRKIPFAGIHFDLGHAIVFEGVEVAWRAQSPNAPDEKKVATVAMCGKC